MKTLWMILLLPLISAQAATLEDCFKDSQDYGDALNNAPAKQCRSLVETHPDRIEAKSPSGRHKLTGYSNMIYIDIYQEAKDAKPLTSTLLAGEQTGLNNIQKIWIYEKRKVFQVLQGVSAKALLTFTLADLSNTAPLRHIVSPVFNGATQIRLLDDVEEIAIMSNTHRTIRFINSDADSVRYQHGKFRPKLLRQIKGERSLLREPKDVAISELLKEIYVLDDNRLLVFDLHTPADAIPKKVVTAVSRETVSLEIKDKDVFGVARDGSRQKLH